MECKKLVHPLVAPRILPGRMAAVTLPCDILLGPARLRDEYPSFIPAAGLAFFLWSTGINVLCKDEFNPLAEEFICFCRSLQRGKIYIVTHDGTITSYRQKLSGHQLTREDFLQETERFHLIVE